MESTQIRNKFLKMCMEMNIPESTVFEISKQMRGKTEAQREEIARKAIEDMEKMSLRCPKTRNEPTH